MKSCHHCGGILYRKGASEKGGERFQCRDCRKSITVRDGNIVKGTGPRVRDWRTNEASMMHVIHNLIHNKGTVDVRESTMRETGLHLGRAVPPPLRGALVPTATEGQADGVLRDGQEASRGSFASDADSGRERAVESTLDRMKRLGIADVNASVICDRIEELQRKCDNQALQIQVLKLEIAYG